jgi:predicted transcriptional regulator
VVEVNLHVTLEDLLLLLLYLTHEQKYYENLHYEVGCASKQYPDYLLELLAAYGDIQNDPKSDSVILTSKGIRRAEEIKKVYLEKP